MSFTRFVTKGHVSTISPSTGQHLCWYIRQIVVKTTPSDEGHDSDQRVPHSQVRWQTAGQWGRGTDSACHLPSEERLSRSKASVKEQTHQSWLHVMSLSKTNVKHYFVCLATAAPKFLKTANKLQLSCPWKLPGFMQKTKCHMLLGGVNPTPSVNLKFVTWTQKQVTSSEIKTIYTNFFRMTNYIHTT